VLAQRLDVARLEAGTLEEPDMVGQGLEFSVGEDVAGEEEP
jgi:hypothetical protein